MQQIPLNNSSIQPKKSFRSRQESFWKRQFQKNATRSQLKFDWIFGVILPFICFAFDPVVFKGNAMGIAFFGTFKPFAYILAYISLSTMTAWLIFGEQLKWLNAFLAPFFFVGGIISLVIGIVLFPFSLFGLIIIIGILGFTPLFTSFVYLRNSFRAFHSIKNIFETKILTAVFILSIVFSLVIPAVINFQIRKNLNEMLNGDVPTIRKSAQTLRYFALITNFDSLALLYHRSGKDKNDEKIKAIAEAYKNLTGENVEENTSADFD